MIWQEAHFGGGTRTIDLLLHALHLARAVTGAADMDATHKHANACVVHCMDLRIQRTVDNLVAALGIDVGEFDRVSVAGGAGNAAQLDEHLRLSDRLHHAKAFVLTAHEDCGAGATRDSLADALSRTLRHYPNHSVRAFWIRLDGSWQEFTAEQRHGRRRP